MSKDKQIAEMAQDIAEALKHNSAVDVIRHGLICVNSEGVTRELYDAGYRKMPDNIGDFSDGYHTFNELYHHRAVLFSVICNMFSEKAWKSKLHDTGDMYDGMFIVGIETEQGQATYHYDIEPYWEMFKVKELEKAPKYDGHTPSDAIARIGNLPCEGYRKQEWISVDERLPESGEHCLVSCKVKRIDGTHGQYVCVGYYAERFKHLAYGVGDDCVSEYSEENDEYYIAEGWYEVIKNWDDYGFVAIDDFVTHWMPLPEAPKMKGDAE